VITGCGELDRPSTESEHGGHMAAEPDIRLRPTAVEDVPTVIAWERDPENAAFVVAWPEYSHRGALQDPTFRHFMIEVGERSVGFLILAGIADAVPVVEFRRIVVAEKGRGIGRTAVAETVRYAFEGLDASAIWLDFVHDNTRARRVYESLGFRVDPDARLSAVINGERKQLVKMTLERAAWEREWSGQGATRSA
jgi:diamine N-acetyltransferase